ncbi:MAG: hypothetical protein A2219_00035 [Elusimicrobia bacterium RIFOXYA2_FULL_50_26]|nr:MAG: hypothetical protein A2219_00035 [Elusimicrobia bacterium RIFOXYA2_FULL_50_26]OGS25338.1 MAG: hypothetical protein A2314_06370 [Elusimicrobia bacterium RIFOXYB2_FULL_50_12]
MSMLALRIAGKLRSIFETVLYFGLSAGYKSAALRGARPRVFFGFTGRKVTAASLKIRKLKKLFGNAYRGANILYVCSGTVPLWYCQRQKKKGAKIILNQNGVYYPGWYGPRYREANEKHLSGQYRLADYILFQSDFCRESAKQYLGKPLCGSEILYNPVDTGVFFPARNRPWNSNEPVLLSTGNFYSETKIERLRLLLESFVALSREYPRAKLIIAGFIYAPLEKTVQKIIRDAAAGERVAILPMFHYSDAPRVYNMGDIYINTQFNDSCPSAVLEAMACGLPVVHLDCGGTPELTGSAGIGVAVEKSWENFKYPPPEKVKDALLNVISRYPAMSADARSRCITHFDERLWKKRHEQLFEKILNDYN